MKKIIVLSLIILAVVFGFIIKDQLFSGLLNIEKGVNDLLKESEKRVFLPSPLILDRDAPESFLNKDEVIRFTNIQREKYGLPPLKESLKLDSSAESKTEDMFDNQYFEHESPFGLDVSDLAGKAGYDYIVLGENLALGNFEDDEALVQAWMDSPGHRENILNPSFAEIGVFVAEGNFKGRKVWIAVQHFALPLSACPEADQSIRYKIEANERYIVEIEEMLNSMKDDLNSRAAVREYNRLVSDHNALVDQNKALIQEYNQQVKTFNQCLSSAT